MTETGDSDKGKGKQSVEHDHTGKKDKKDKKDKGKDKKENKDKKDKGKDKKEKKHKKGKQDDQVAPGEQDVAGKTAFRKRRDADVGTCIFFAPRSAFFFRFFALSQEAAKRQRTGQSASSSTQQAASSSTVDDDDLQQVVRKQRDLLAKKKEVMVRAPAQGPTPYVTPFGGLMQGQAASVRAAPPPPPPPSLPRGPAAVIGVVLGRGAGQCHLEKPFMQTSVERAMCVVVGDIEAHWDSPEALAARLHGRRLVDCRWVQTNSKAGRCVAFQSILNIRHYDLFLSPGFCRTYPDHAKALESAAELSPVLVSGAPRLKVVRGPRPDAPPHPRCAFSIRSDAEYYEAGGAAHSWNIAQLIAHFSVLHGPERAR